MKLLTEEDVRKLLRRATRGRSQAETARELGISSVMLSHILSGRKKRPGIKVLKTLGLKRVILYRKTIS